MEHLQYPIGKFKYQLESDNFDHNIQVIESFPASVKQLLSDGLGQKLDILYRPEGWTGRQVIHHCADSHLHAYTRTRLALTEDSPTIKPYDEAAHASMLPDYGDGIEDSLALIEILHKRWVHMLRSLKPSDLERTYVHPASRRIYSIREVCASYAWHCEHHLGHLKIIAAV